MQQTTTTYPLSLSLPAPEQPTVRSPHLLGIVWPYLRPLLPIVLVTVVLWLLHHEFSDYRLEDIRTSFRSISPVAILAAVGLTVCNYAVMIGYDCLGVRLVYQPISLRQVTIASLISYGFSNSLGTLFGGTPVRVRLYTAWGMSPPEIVLSGWQRHSTTKSRSLQTRCRHRHRRAYLAAAIPLLMSCAGTSPCLYRR